MGTKKPNVTIDTVVKNGERDSIDKQDINKQFKEGFFKQIVKSFIKITIISTLFVATLFLIYFFIFKGSSFDILVSGNKIDLNANGIVRIEKKLATAEERLTGLQSLENKINLLDTKINIFIEDYNINPLGNNLEKFNLIDNKINNVSLKIVSLEKEMETSENLSIDKKNSKKSNNIDLIEPKELLITTDSLLDKVDKDNQDLVILKKQIYQLTEDLNKRNILTAELLYKDILSNAELNNFFVNEVIELKKLFPGLTNIKRIEILSNKIIPTKDTLLKDLDKLQLIDIPKIEGNNDVMSKFLNKVSKEITIRRVDNGIENISLSDVRNHIIDNNMEEAISLITELSSNNITKDWIIKANSRLEFLTEIKILNNYILEQKNKKFILKDNFYE